MARWGYLIEPTEAGDREIRLSAEIIVGTSVEALEPGPDAPRW